MDERFARTGLLLGADALSAIRSARVAVFGLGGVGSWCAESLVRSGVRQMMLVDADTVAASNLNRQLPATEATIGRPKALVLAERLREISHDVQIDARVCMYDHSTSGTFALESFDYVVDAIDSLDCKAELIRHALSIPCATLFSSMGAALKTDVFQIRKSEFRKVEGDGLARALRGFLRRTGGLPEKPFLCVWSPEKRENQSGIEQGKGNPPGVKRANGTVAHVTASFGFALAGLVIEDIIASH